MAKLRLGINIDHVATLRNARGRHARARPDLVRAASEALRGGADSITVHLREDRRHILDADIDRLRIELAVPLNLEMAATPEMKALALRVRPHAVCLVPEKRQEVTTEGGLDVVRGGRKLARVVNELAASGLRTALFINPDPEQVMAAYVAGAHAIELHTGTYCETKGSLRKRALRQLLDAARQAKSLGLEVHAGHGLNYENVAAVAAIPEIVELNIGHFLIGEAVFIGLFQAVRAMRQIMTKARR